jgi:hypothetical protein
MYHITDVKFCRRIHWKVIIITVRDKMILLLWEVSITEVVCGDKQ